MYSFKNDYSEGAHPRILAALTAANLEQSEGYGEDSYSLEAIKLLKQDIGLDDLDIHLFAGGTQTNLTALAAFLRPHEAAIAPSTGHVLVHETGAIEATGHKVIAVASSDGKLRADQVGAVLAAHSDEHMVKPRLVYISNPTEIGTIYTKAELEELSRLCRKNALYLYVDGARLGSALTAAANDLALTELARLVDAFYIGGTKGGALLGEALVIRHPSLRQDFRYHMKQRGALLAKGRLLGIQFLEFFRDGLYFALARHANKMAVQLANACQTAGYDFLTPPATNQIFPILPNRLIRRLQEKYAFYVWSDNGDDRSAVRLVTSWATPETAVAEFIADLSSLRE